MHHHMQSEIPATSVSGTKFPLSGDAMLPDPPPIFVLLQLQTKIAKQTGHGCAGPHRVHSAPVSTISQIHQPAHSGRTIVK